MEVDNLTKVKLVFVSYLYSTRLSWEFNKSSLCIMTFYNIMLGILPATLLWTSQHLINAVTLLIQHKNGFLTVTGLFLLQITITFGSFVCRQFLQIENKKIENSYGLGIHKKIFEKISHLPYKLFESPDFQNKYQRIKLNQNNIMKMSNDGFKFLSGLISLFTVLGFLLSVSLWFIPLLIFGVLPLFIIQLKFGNKKFQVLKSLTPYGRKANYLAYLLDHREPLKEVKLFRLEKHLVHQWTDYFKLNAFENLKLLKKQSLWLLIAEIFLMITYVASGFIAILLISAGKILIGSFVAVLQAIQRIQGTLNNISSLLSSFYESSLIISEFRSFLELNEIENRNKTKKIDRVNTIQLKELTFYYPNHSEPTLKNITFEIRSGKKIAIVGANGSGKTTLIKCLTGLYETKDSITVNNIPIEELNLNSYFDRVATLFQDYNQYELTAQENIGFGKISSLENVEEIRKAAMKTGMDSYFMGSSEQYRTQLGRMFQGGTGLSGGQWQKVALSRSLFRKGDVIFLDEPTSALDPKSEVEILEHLFKTTDKQALVFITHRLGAACLADEILVMKDGRIIEKGSHQNLLSLGGEYSRMYRSQSKWYTNLNMEVMS